MEIIKNIIDDSFFLQSLNLQNTKDEDGDEEEINIEKLLPWSIKLLKKIYANPPNFTFLNNDKSLIKLSNQLNFLQSGKLIEILIICKFRNLTSKLLPDLINISNNLNFKENIELTMISYGFLDYIIYLQSGKDFLKACEKGNLEIIKHLYNNELINKKLINEGFITVSYKGYLDCVKYLSTLKEFDIFNDEYHEVDKGAFEEACIYNKIDVAKYIYYILLKKSKKYVTSTIIETILKNYISINGYDTLKWLLSINTVYKNNINNIYLLSTCRSALNLETLKIVMNYIIINNSAINTTHTKIWNEDLTTIFTRSCEYGKLDVSEYLYEKIDYIITQSFFDEVCKNGLKKLSSYTSEIIYMSEYLIKKSVEELKKWTENNYYNMITWMFNISYLKNSNLEINKKIFNLFVNNCTLKMIKFAYINKSFIFDDKPSVMFYLDKYDRKLYYKKNIEWLEEQYNI